MDWWQGACAAVQRLLRETSVPPEAIAAVGVSGMVPAIVLLDSRQTPLRPSIQQNDGRSSREVEQLADLLSPDEVFRRTRSRLNQQHVLPRMLWLQHHEPEIYAQVRHVLGSYDYINFRLTGEFSIEANWAVESGLYDLEQQRFVEPWLEIANIAPQWLPHVHAPTDVIGTVTPDAATATGLHPGTPVVAGSADHVASALAAGLHRTGDLLIKFGGAGDILYCTDRQIAVPELYFDLHDIPGLYLPNGCMAASGSLVKWFRRNFAQDLGRDDDALAALDTAAAEIPPGSGGVVVLPYFLGEKTPIFDAQARGVIFGLGLNHTRANVFRAVLESVIYGFRHHIEALEHAGEPPQRVFASDGGTRSALWRQIAADALHTEVTSFPNHAGSALGVAFVAGMSQGVFRDWPEIEAFLAGAVRNEPDALRGRRYDDAYAIYRDLYPRLRTLYPQLRPLED